MVTDAADIQSQDTQDWTAGDTQPTDQLEPGMDGVEPEDRVEDGAEEVLKQRQQAQAFESASDRENEALRQALAQYALNDEIRRAQADEDHYAAADQQMIEQGQLTSQEASQRSQERANQRGQRIRSQQQQMQMASQAQMIQTKGEQIGRIIAAQDIAEKFGVKADDLIRDASLTTPQLMQAKAREMQLDAREAKMKGYESYDTGRGAGRGPDLNKMSPSELTSLAYSEAETTRRNRRKRR